MSLIVHRHKGCQGSTSMATRFVMRHSAYTTNSLTDRTNAHQALTILGPDWWVTNRPQHRSVAGPTRLCGRLGPSRKGTTTPFLKHMDSNGLGAKAKQPLTSTPPGHGLHPRVSRGKPTLEAPPQWPAQANAQGTKPTTHETYQNRRKALPTHGQSHAALSAVSLMWV